MPKPKLSIRSQIWWTLHKIVDRLNYWLERRFARSMLRDAMRQQGGCYEDH